MISWNIIRLPSVASTMDEIDVLGEGGAPSGAVVAAAEQRQGRGRAGRTWSAPPGSGLFVSILYRPNLSVSQVSSLPLIVGVAVAEAIEAVAGVQCRLKWPNDVLIEDAKTAGILVSTRSQGDRIRFVNIGIGVNCTSTEAQLPAGAASVYSATGKLVPPDWLLPELLTRLGIWLESFEHWHGRPSLEAWWARAAYRHEPVQLLNNGDQLRGTLVGIDDDGALVIVDEQGCRVRVTSGDLTRGPGPTSAR